MKSLVLILAGLIFFNGCKEDKVVDSESVNTSINKKEYLTEAEEMPQPKGGIEAVLQNVVYPEDAKNKGIEGKVVLKAYVNEDGKVVEVEIIKSVNSELDSAAKSALEKTDFIPAYQNDEPVKFQIIIPVVFKLNGNSISNAENLHPDFLLNMDEMPKPIGGIEAIAQKIVYPQKEKDNKIEGKVLVRALIDEEGNVIKTEIVKGVNQGLNKAAINAIKEIKFIPGKVGGKSVKSQVTIPLTFKLK